MISYRTGDATSPQERPAVIAHVVNDVGAFGAGFSGALAQRYPLARQSYRQWFQGAYDSQIRQGSAMPFRLGSVLLIRPVPEDANLFLAHLLAQRGIGTDKRRVDYSALSDALGALYNLIVACVDMSVHMPRIGCGLGGGQWWEVERCLRERLPCVPTFVYTLPASGRPA